MRTKNEEGQALVLILLVLIIGATVAFSIAMRTIQDIRRSGQERASETSGNQVLSILDAVTGGAIWDQLVDGESFREGGFCDDLLYDNIHMSPIAGMPICVLNQSAIENLLGVDTLPVEEKGIVCDEDTAEVQIRLENGINEQVIKKDSVYEVNLTNDTDNSFLFSWTSGSCLIFTYYSNTGTNGAWVIDDVVAYGDTDVLGWPSILISADGNVNSIVYPAKATGPSSPHQQYLRIRAIDEAAVVTLSGIPPQQFAIRGSCYLGGTYREFVRLVPILNFVPAVFDYVLFDGTSVIDEHL